MRRTADWRPTKFVERDGRLRASLDRTHVGVASRVLADRIAEAFGESIGEFVHGDVADLGCGSVPLYEAYRRQAARIVCADWPSTFHQQTHLDLFSDLNRGLPFRDRAFDTVILSDVLEHLYAPWQLWSELHRVLRPDGTVLVSVPFYYKLHETPYDYYRYTEFGLRHLAETNGFAVRVLRALGGSLEVLTDLVARHIERVPVAGRPAALSIQVAAGAVGRSGFGRRVSRSTGRHFPLGYFMVAQKPAGVAARG